MRSAVVTLGFAADASGRGISYVRLAANTGTAIVKVPFTVRNLSVDEAMRAQGAAYTAVAAVGAYLRLRGFTRVDMLLADEVVVAVLNVKERAAAPVAVAFFQAKAVLAGFHVVRVEQAEPFQVHDLAFRARAERDLFATRSAVG